MFMLQYCIDNNTIPITIINKTKKAISLFNRLYTGTYVIYLSSLSTSLKTVLKEATLPNSDGKKIFVALPSAILARAS